LRGENKLPEEVKAKPQKKRKKIPTTRSVYLKGGEEVKSER